MNILVATLRNRKACRLATFRNNESLERKGSSTMEGKNLGFRKGRNNLLVHWILRTKRGKDVNSFH